MKPGSEDAPAGLAQSVDPFSRATAGPDVDAELVRRARTDDRAALDELVLRYQEPVARLLWRFVRNKADLDDLVQDTFLRMVRGLPGWSARQPFRHWLLRIATNTGRDFFRRQRVRQRWTAEPSRREDFPEPEAVDPAPNPGARAAADEIKTILAELPPDDRALLTLHHLEGWGLNDIAANYGWTLTATKLRAWRARGRLKKLLAEKGISS